MLSRRSCLTGVALAGVARHARAEDDAAEQAERWDLVRGAVYGDRAVADGAGALEMTLPPNSFNAWLVPVGVKLNPERKFVSLALFVDNNPSPLVGIFRFGPAWVAGTIKTRIRVDNPTLVHAVGETADGHLLAVSKYISAAGGCAAPVTGQMADILRMIGQMRLRRTRPLHGDAIDSQLMLNHPNFNGMQTGAQSMTIPPRYLEDISVATGGVMVFDLQSSISLSEDPVINFTYRPAGTGGVVVTARESTGTVFTRHYEPLAN